MASETAKATCLSEENRRDRGRIDQGRRILVELKKILEIEGLLDTYSHLFEDDDAAGHKLPVNNYSGLNSLRARLKNRHWDGKSLLEGEDSYGDVRAHPDGYFANELEQRGIPADRIIKVSKGGIADHVLIEANRHTKVELLFRDSGTVSE